MSTNRFLHPSMPRRPMRTSESAEDILRSGFVFSHVNLRAEACTRTIVGKVVNGTARVEIKTVLEHRVRSIWIFADTMAVYARAARDALTAPPGRYNAGRIEFGRDTRLRVWARVTHDARFVLIGHVNDRDEHHGRLWTLAEAEVRGLSHALEWLERNA